MKKLSKSLIVILTVALCLPAMAQELPQPSPAAKLEQRVGLTDITVAYSRPSVKGREIYGKLVPFGEVWRTGANASTKVTFSTDVKIMGKELKAGTYAFFAKPGKDSWTLHFNTKIDGWGTDGYEAKNDAAMGTVKPTACNHVESLRYTVENIKENSADLVLSWGKVSIAMKIEIDVKKQALANIEEALKDDKWRVYRNAANYMADNKVDLVKAKEYIAKSIELNPESWYSFWVQADVLAANNDKKGAIKSAEKAIELGEASAKKNNRPFSYKEELETSIAGWKKK